MAGDDGAMDPITLGLDTLPKKTRNEVFLEEVNQVAPWSALAALIQPHARGAHQAVGGRPPFAVETMQRIYCLHLSWNLSDPAMEVKDSKVSWEITMRPSKRRALDPERQAHQLLETIEKRKASIGASRASFSNRQAAVRLRQGALPGSGQEHRAADDVVCACQRGMLVRHNA